MYALPNMEVSRYFLLLERLPDTLVTVRSDALLPPNARGKEASVYAQKMSELVYLFRCV